MTSHPRRTTAWFSGPRATSGLARCRAVIEHPQMTLVGLHVHAPEKEGLDAGSTLRARSDRRLGDPGPRRHPGAEAGLRPLYAAGHGHRHRSARCSNPASTSWRPAASSTTRAAWTRQSGSASRTHASEVRTSIHSTGISPGFISEAMPIVLTSIQRSLDRLQDR